MIDLRNPQHIHIVGLGGAGMSAIAEILMGTGHKVSGSDLTDSAPLRRLADAGVDVWVGHDADHIAGASVVAISTAIPDSNPEVVQAKRSGIQVLRRAEILAAITKAWTTISVAGTHGKTTTSAMLTVALQGAGLDPAFIVGGDLRDIGRGAAVGDGNHLVVEADESDGTFVELDSTGVVITNIEPDHLEYYGGFEGLKAAFVKFIQNAKGPRVVCIDDPGVADLLAGLSSEYLGEVITYGIASDAMWRITEPLPTPVGIGFRVAGPSGEVEIALQQPGMHNARNATAALAMAGSLGADINAAASALSNFGGVGRRFEVRGEHDGMQLVDDYAHLPTEVEAALSGARSLAPTRLIAVFQPHRYSRTEHLWSTFTNSFNDADVLFVTGIYSAGEVARAGISGKLIADDVAAAHPGLDVRYIPDLDDVATALTKELVPGDLCITLGAGDLTTIPDRVLEGLRQR